MWQGCKIFVKDSAKELHKLSQEHHVTLQKAHRPVVRCGESLELSELEILRSAQDDILG